MISISTSNIIYNIWSNNIISYSHIRPLIKAAGHSGRLPSW